MKLSRRGGGRRLRHQRLQTVLAVIAVATAVALPVVLLSVGGGVSQHEINALQHSGYQVAVDGAGVHGVSNAHRLSLQIDALGSVAAASPVLSVPVDAFIYTATPTPVLAEGVVPAAFEATEGPTERSLFPSPLPLGDPSDLVHFDNGTYAGPSAGQVLVSSPLAHVYNIAPGAMIRVGGSANASLAQRFLVGGIFGVAPTVLGPTAAFAVLLPLSDLQVMTGTARLGGISGSLLDQADTIQVALTGAASTDAGTIDAVSAEVAALVPFYTVMTLADQAAQLASLSQILAGFYVALSSVSLTIGVTFLALVQLRRVESRRALIGVRRAIGLPARSIASDLVREGLMLAGAGALLGVAAGILLIGLLAAYSTGAVQQAAQLAVFDPVVLAGVVAGILAFSLLSSGLASRAALRISIPEALR